MPMAEGEQSSYVRAGVNQRAEEDALRGLLQWVKKTFPFPEPRAKTLLTLGYFANVIDTGGPQALALSTDGVGTKILVAELMDKYDTLGIDCMAMNVNDILCVGARPVAFMDYIAVEEVKAKILDEIGKGLYEGAKRARVAIVGGEVAQLQEMVKGVEGKGFDLVGSCLGLVDRERIIIGSDIQEGDVLLGLKSTGIHSNGLTLARRVLFTHFKPDQHVEELGRALGEELLEPTAIYVDEVMALLEANLEIKALLNITGGGLLNIRRIEAERGFVIEALPEPPPIFSLIQRLGQIPQAEMLSVFNMGVGFCLVVSEKDLPEAEGILQNHGQKPFRLGYATKKDPKRQVIIPSLGLVGQEGGFSK